MQNQNSAFNYLRLREQLKNKAPDSGPPGDDPPPSMVDEPPTESDDDNDKDDYLDPNDFSEGEYQGHDEYAESVESVARGLLLQSPSSRKSILLSQRIKPLNMPSERVKPFAKQRQKLNVEMTRTL